MKQTEYIQNVDIRLSHADWRGWRFILLCAAAMLWHAIVHRRNRRVQADPLGMRIDEDYLTFTTNSYITIKYSGSTKFILNGLWRLKERQTSVTDEEETDQEDQ